VAGPDVGVDDAGADEEGAGVAGAGCGMALGTNGAGAAGDDPGASGPEPGAVGAPGSTGMVREPGPDCGPEAAGAITEPPVRFAFAIIARASDVAMKTPAKMTVIRDSAFAAPRPDIKLLTPPPPPRPSAPPSDRCRRIVTTMATATRA
jgi:hypothetical protein